MTRDTRKEKKQKGRARPHRPKIDARLAYILSIASKKLLKLKQEEDHQLEEIEGQVERAVGELKEDMSEKKKGEVAKKLQELGHKVFAPLYTGLYLPGERGRGKAWPANFKEPYVSVFILSDASARDLTRLGVKVRSKEGDIFTAFVPVSLIPRLEAVSAIRYIELARPLFGNLNQAVPFTQINTLQSAVPPVTGTGVIVGISDTVLDFYHPDFRAAGGATRVLFLWDQRLIPQGAEVSPPVAPALPGFTPVGGTSYGVEYTQANINTELTNFNPPAVPAYQTVRHGGSVGAHGTHVAGIAAGNGLGQAGSFTGAAPGANIIFVANPGLQNSNLLSDSSFVADAFAYIFARAALLGQPCVINMSNSDNQGPHDGSTLGEQFLDNLLLTPGRAITLSAGNSNNTSAHAAGSIAGGATVNLVLNYAAGAGNSDDIEIWYDGHDRISLSLTIPTAPATVIGPVAPGATANATLANGVIVQVVSVLNDARNGDNLISVIISVPAGQTIAAGNWNFALTGTTIINGNFQAWVDRNNRGLSFWQAPFLQENQLTLGVPATAHRVLTVGNHDKTAPTPFISGSSGRGPTRDGRIKPEIATVGTGVTAPRSRNMNTATPGALYVGMSGTSMSAPLAAGACALLFQCRGGTATWANLKQILEDTAGTAGIAVPANTFGFGFMQMATACTVPAPAVDVWLRDDNSDTGLEPFTGPVIWLSPDIEVLDSAGNPATNPTYDPVKRFNNIIRVTVRNRGTQVARNTEVYFYWADPATNIPYPAAWNTTGIYTGAAPNFPVQDNKIVIPQLAGGASTQVSFAWAPPAPGSNIRGDDHFCLLVRLENESDASQIGAGGWSAISARNNVGLRNTHVQPDIPGDSDMSFYVVGSGEQDSLVITPQLKGGVVRLSIPVQALPWRDLRSIEKWKGRRLPYGCSNDADPLLKLKAQLKGSDVELTTDIRGAELLELKDGVVSIQGGRGQRIIIPYLRLEKGVKMAVSVRVSNPRTDRDLRFVHVTQLSGGQVIGGVSLEFKKRKQ